MDEECPYCGKEQEIVHDDGYGMSEGERFQQDCDDCGKTFTFETTIIIDHRLRKADCLNGSPHKMRPVKHAPKYWPNWVRCLSCGKEEKGEFHEAKE